VSSDTPEGGPFYRGGPSLQPHPQEVRIDQQTGLLATTHGISLHRSPARLRRFGAVYEVLSIPEGLKVQQRGRDPQHFELMPAQPMTLEQYRQLLDQVRLRQVE